MSIFVQDKQGSPDDSSRNPAMLMNIGAVERDTGLSKDTLRMWERRYAFPTPERDQNGERIYSPIQVQKLRLIKHLIDLGYRPGKIIGQSIEELESMGGTRATSESPTNPVMEAFLSLIKSHQSAELRHRLSLALALQGLKSFVLETVAPLNSAVGNAWMNGALAVFEEHLYSELVRSTLRNAISAIHPQGTAPRVLLTSLPGEKHSLGLLMAEAMFAVEGAFCVSLGNETPVRDIAAAAEGHRADIVALSFSASYSEQKALEGLQDLRQLMPPASQIWAGGSAIARIRKPPADVQLIGSLADIAGHVVQWRSVGDASHRDA